MNTEDDEFNRIEREAAMRKEAVSATVQKPMHPEIKKMYEDYFDKCFRASSAQRKWVELTEEAIWSEYQVLWPFHPAEEPRLAKDIVKFARAIEAKLKEKND
jgi:hypothetical protein